MERSGVAGCRERRKLAYYWRSCPKGRFSSLADSTLTRRSARSGAGAGRFMEQRRNEAISSREGGRTHAVRRCHIAASGWLDTGYESIQQLIFPLTS